jgi:hypothetical protein
MGGSGGAAPGAGRRPERIKEFEEDEVYIMEVRTRWILPGSMKSKQPSLSKPSLFPIAQGAAPFLF